MFRHSMDAFLSFDPECIVIVVVHPDYLDNPEILSTTETENGIYFTAGGESRIESVKNGLDKANSLSDELSLDKKLAKVFIHDGARPNVTAELIERGAGKVEKGRGAIPVVPVVDSIRELTDEGSVAVDRSRYVAVQTPQVFMLEDISDAYSGIKEESTLTDDASVAERAGIKINLYTGDSNNFKVTNPSDFKRL